jgi:hypothetical protein
MTLTVVERDELAAKISSGGYDSSAASLARVILLWDIQLRSTSSFEHAAVPCSFLAVARGPGGNDAPRGVCGPIREDRRLVLMRRPVLPERRFQPSPGRFDDIAVPAGPVTGRFHASGEAHRKQDDGRSFPARTLLSDVERVTAGDAATFRGMVSGKPGPRARS